MSNQIWIFLGMSLSVYLLLSIMHMLGHLIVSFICRADLETASFGIGPKLFKLWKNRLWIRTPILFCEELNFKPALNDPDNRVDSAGNAQSGFWKNAVVILSGPIISFLTAAILLACVHAGGSAVLLPIVGKVVDGSPAENAGFEKGDRILSIDDVDVASWSELVEYISNTSGETLNIKYQCKEKWGPGT